MSAEEDIQQEIELLAKYSDQDLNDHILSMSSLITSVHYHDTSLKDGVDVDELRDLILGYAKMNLCEGEDNIHDGKVYDRRTTNAVIMADSLAYKSNTLDGQTDI